MSGILFSLIPLFFWGIGDYMSSRLSKGLHPAAINLVLSVIGGVPIIIISLFFGTPEFGLKIMMLYIGVSLLLSGGFISMVRAFSVGATGVVSPIANAYAVVTILVAVLFLKVETSLLQVMSVLIVVFGISLLSYEKSTDRMMELNSSIVYAVIALVLFGFGFAGFDIAATQQWYQNIVLYEISTVIVGILIVSIWLKKDSYRQIKKVLKIKDSVYGGLSIVVGTLGLFIAISKVENVAIPATIAAASPLVTVALARHFDKEHLRIHQYVGGLIIVLGISALSISA